MQPTVQNSQLAAWEFTDTVTRENVRIEYRFLAGLVFGYVNRTGPGSENGGRRRITRERVVTYVDQYDLRLPNGDKPI
jgi:hypothetical protein